LEKNKKPTKEINKINFVNAFKSFMRNCAVELGVTPLYLLNLMNIDGQKKTVKYEI